MRPANRRSTSAVSAGLLSLATLLLVAAPVDADPAAEPEASAVTSAEVALTPEEEAERESRKACKIEICRAFHDAAATAAGDVQCNVVKSWRKSQLDKIVGKMKVSWPYGPVVCKTDLSLPRADLAKALGTAKHAFTLKEHAVTCQVMREKGDPTDIEIRFAPSVTFENGKATDAAVNWGKLKAPTMLKGLLWPATAADNATGLLSGMLVDDINTFTGKKCDEVRDAWKAP